jgi:eukaryotic-like serine/threonine-protein kinase
VTCPHCHAPLVAHARFCPACGKATSPTESGSAWPASASAPDLIGREIGGRYRIVKKLGEGGMGAVYRGEQISLKRAVAVKLLRPELGSNQMVLRRFNAEAEAVAKLSHPNTVNIYDFGQDSDGSLFIAMEFIEGRSLREAIQKEGPLPPTRAFSIALQVAASLSDAHACSIVHRDLKPDNVMLQDRGRHKDVVRVLDFGIAKLRDDNRATQQAMTQAGDMLGTPQYMAPEQIRGETIDGRTDVYALGCLIYEMVTARLPFEAATVMAMLSKHLVEAVVPPSRRRPDLAIPPAVDQLVLHAMAKDPAARPATMDQLAEMLQAVLAQLPADPNRSAGMSLPQGAVAPSASPSFQRPAMSPPTTPPPLAPAADTFPPPTTPPPQMPPGSFGAPSGPAPTANVRTSPTPSAPAKGRALVYVALAALVLGGVGAGVYFATRDESTLADAGPPRPDPWDPRGSGSALPPDQEPDEPREPDEPDEPDKPPRPEVDPWASREPPSGVTNVASAPAKPSRIGTAQTPIPPGAKLKVGSGFTSVVNDEAHLHVDARRGITLALAPLFPGTNDPEQLGELWAAQTGVTMTGSMNIKSAGKQRDAVGFNGVAADGTPMSQVIVVYIEPAYRVGVLYQAPATRFADSAFQREVMRFFARNVVLPAGASATLRR